MFADLHLHSNFSDGTFTPEELVARADQLGFSALALTDHDTVEGCARMAAACQQKGIDFISGAEFTAEWVGNELHLLGYLIEIEDPALLEEITRFQSVRQERIREMVARLNRINIPLEADAVFRIANCRSPGRPHVGRALVQGGFCSTMDEAFERFLKRHRPAWVPKFRMSAAEAISLIHRAGGVAVMAHPGLNRTDELIPQLVEMGLDGLECYHTKHSSLDCERYLELAELHHLLVTGGSDCHGMNKGQPLIGTIKLPLIHVEQLKARRPPRQPGAAPGISLLI
jgi:3',5'-nucleoside bisphosphate phosphatase